MTPLLSSTISAEKSPFWEFLVYGFNPFIHSNAKVNSQLRLVDHIFNDGQKDIYHNWFITTSTTVTIIDDNRLSQQGELQQIFGNVANL